MFDIILASGQIAAARLDTCSLVPSSADLQLPNWTHTAVDAVICTEQRSVGRTYYCRPVLVARAWSIDIVVRQRVNYAQSMPHASRPRYVHLAWMLFRVGHGSVFQNPTRPNPQKVFTRPNPTQPIIYTAPLWLSSEFGAVYKYPDLLTYLLTWYGILGYTENFIQQLLHVTDKFTVNESYYSAAVLINRQ